MSVTNLFFSVSRYDSRLKCCGCVVCICVCMRVREGERERTSVLSASHTFVMDADAYSCESFTVVL